MSAATADDKCTIRGERVTRVEEKVHNLEGWQAAQNGAIHRVEDRVEKMHWWLLGAVFLLFCNTAGTIVMLLSKGGN